MATGKNLTNYDSDVLLTGTAYADAIDNSGDNVSINAGAGNDYIYNNGYNTTILGGKGNDTIYYSSEVGMVYVYKSGEGNDYIRGFGLFDTLVVDGAKYTTKKAARMSSLLSAKIKSRSKVPPPLRR